MDAVSEMQARDIENTQLYADQKKSIIEKLNTDLLEIQASSTLLSSLSFKGQQATSPASCSAQAKSEQHSRKPRFLRSAHWL